MKVLTYFNSGKIILLTILFSITFAVQVASSAPCIPEGADIYSATFSIYVNDHDVQEVRLHRVTAPWIETEINWNNFGGSYDPSVEGVFVSDAYGWQSVDVTELLQLWVDGTYPNFGLLLEQDQTQRVGYASSEDSVVEHRPKLEICYFDGFEVSCITIQRPGVEQGGVADAYIWELSPYFPGGYATTLFTGPVISSATQSLVRFDFEICPEEFVPEGTSGHGYWKRHSEEWPINEITIGGITYTKDEAVSLMWLPVKGDKTLKMFRALVSAKLNVMSGNEDACIAETILAADDWMETYGPVGSGVKGKCKAWKKSKCRAWKKGKCKAWKKSKCRAWKRGKRQAWKEGKQFYSDLNDYNRGLLCAPHRE